MPYEGEHRQFLNQLARQAKIKTFCELLEKSKYTPRITFADSTDEFALEVSEVEFILERRRVELAKLDKQVKNKKKKYFGE